MPVAHLVNLFESMDHTMYGAGLSKQKKRNFSFSSGRRLSLRTMFGSHSRASSASSTASRIASSTTSPSSPTHSSGSFDFSVMASTNTSPESDRGVDTFDSLPTASQLASHRAGRPYRPAKSRRTLSSTSIALQAEYQVDRLESPGLDLFEPRPHNAFGSSQSTFEPVVMDGIMQVIESG